MTIKDEIRQLADSLPEDSRDTLRQKHVYSYRFIARPLVAVFHGARDASRVLHERL